MKGVLAICDPEKEYARNLMVYLNGKKSFPLKTAAFSSRENLEEYLSGRHADIILINEALMKENDNGFRDSHTLILSEDLSGPPCAYDRIFKYQSADAILNEVMSCYDAQRLAEGEAELKKNLVIGVFSPVPDIRKNIIALAIAMICSEQKNVLYLNHGTFAPEDNNEEAGLSDLIYYLRRNKERITDKLQALALPFRDVDIILPASSIGDIQGVRIHEWKQLYKEILKKSRYDCLVLDMGSEVAGITELLSGCDRVFLPDFADPWNARALNAFKKSAAACNPEINIINIPADKEVFFEPVLSGEELPWADICEMIFDQVRMVCLDGI